MTERDIFLAALEIDDLDARQAHVESACAGDTELLSRVQALLASHESQSQFLDTPAVEQISADSQANSDATIPDDSGSTGADDSDDNRTRDEVAETMIEDSAHMPEHSTFSFLSRSDNPESIGRLGHYGVKEVLGKGAFGIVFKAFDEKLHRVVAIKVLAPEMAATSPARKRFLREARSSAAVRHENVVAIYAVEEEPIPYLVMEYIPGKTLQDRLNEQGPLDVSEVLRIGKQIADGLAAAHAQGLIHRDIKPGNILLDTSINDHVKITDFGLARAADDASVTQSGVIAGTPMYMAPEQAQGQKLDTRADLFSLGSVLYQMVSGRPPFRAPSTVAVLKRVVDEEPRPIREIIPETPNWLCEIIGKLHAKDPEKRFQSAGEVSAILAQCLKQYQQDGVVTGVEKSDMEADTVVTKVEKSKPAGGSNSTWWWLGGVSLVLMALIYVAAINLFNPQTANNALTDNTPENAPIPSSFTALPGWQGWPIDAPPPAIAPFTVEEAKMYQVAWATYLGVPVEYTNSIGMKFRLIPPGEFMMGSTPEEIEAALKEAPDWRRNIQSEGPQHKVVLTQPVYVGVTEVTQTQYEQVLRTNPSHFSATGEGKEAVADLETGNHPVEMVSWNDAAEFCAKLSQQEELKPFYFRSGETITPLDGTGYRLPTEAEWESACRSGTTTRFWSGDADQDLVSTVWFGSNSGGRTHAAGELKANPFGLWDVHGNVWEWGQDSWDSAFYGKFEENAAINPSSPFSAGSRRVVRGGSWHSSPFACRSSYRYANFQTSRSPDFGFRVVLPVDAVKESLQRNLTESSPVELFNGKDLTGWKMHPDATGNWRVENGELISDGKPSYLFSERNDYGDFELNCEVSISDGGDSGLIVRSPFEKVGPNGLPGYEAQIQAGKVLTAGWATGAIAQSGANTGWSLKQSSSISVPPNEYFTLKVRVAHNCVKTYVNGVQVAEYIDPAWTYQRGHIALQHSGAQTVIRFRKITLTELVPDTRASAAQTFALQFDGVDDYVELPIRLGMVGRYVSDRPFTYEAFVTAHRQRDEVTATKTLPPHLAPGVLGFFRIGAVTLIPGKHLSDWVEAQQIYSDSPILENEEHHIAMVWDGQAMQLFVDGVPQRLGRAEVPPLDPTSMSDLDQSPFSLCGMRTPRGFSNTFAGTIREVRISTTARYTDNFVPQQRLTTDADTIGLYHCDDGSGESLIDSSGHNRHGTIIGAKWLRRDAPPGPAVDPRASEFALQFDGVDDYVEWADLPFPNRQPFKVEFSATVEEIPDDDNALYLLNWGRAVFISCRHDDHYGPILYLQLLADDGSIHAWSIVDKLIQGTRFDFVVEGRNGVVELTWNGETIPELSYVYKQFRNEQDLGSSAPLVVQPVATDSFCFLGVPTSSPKALQGAAYCGKIHSLRLSEGANADIAKFDFSHDTGDTLRDLSGNGHDGKIVGAKWVRVDATPNLSPPSQFALQFDGMDDCVEWSELPVPLDRPVRIELAATVDSIQAAAVSGIPIFNWGGAVDVSAAADPNVGDVLIVRFLSDPGVHHTWHIRNAVEAGRRFSLVVDFRDGVANFSVDGRPVPTSQLRYGLHRDGEWNFDAQPEIFRLVSDMKRSFLATPSTHPDQKSMALHGKVHHLKLTQDAGDTIAEFDFTKGSGDTLRDLSGNGHDGKIVGAKWVRRDGPHSPPRDRQASDVALQFDGVDDYVDLGENIAVDFDQPLTLEAWVWADRNADQEAHQAIISLPPHQLGVREKGEGKWQHLIWADPLQSQSLATVRSRQLKRPVKTDVFVHLASVWQGNAAGKQLQLFLDGELIHTLDITEPLSISDQFRHLALLGIEQIGDELVNPFAGMIREVRISNTARYSGDFVPAERFETDEHTLALYHFDEGQGDVLKDASGNGHDGKIVGATWVRTGPPTTVAQNQFDWSTLWPADAPPPAIAPFTADEAKAHQEAWAKYLGVPVEYENSIGMKFRLIPPGEFMMGSTPEEIEIALDVTYEANDEEWRQQILSEAPKHKVIIKQPIFVGTTEVTQFQYEEVMKANPAHFSSSGDGKDAVLGLDTGHFPVETVSWNDAVEFTAKLSQLEQLDPFYFRSDYVVTPLPGTGYRLPSEAEWEYFCRAGTTTQFWSGDHDNDIAQVGWTVQNAGGRTHAVGKLRANPFGLFDVHGNVWEWAQDSWSADFYASLAKAPSIAPMNPFLSSFQRVVRGGLWISGPSRCRSAFRGRHHQAYHRSHVGFRVVLTVDAVKRSGEPKD
ncbi:MAG: SUMF1/EgtB/PvdO family nonheme iron enzyme [Planctomycetaceae bacterium]